jgi:ATPase subunit of ABC transporter with duplicated ATPase domains
MLQLGRTDRIRLEGPNGAGKSSLLAALRSAAGPDADRLLWLPQELGAAARAEALDAVRALDTAARGRTLELVAALGADPGRLLASRAPSPGEAVKLLLARALARQVWGLVLDEPTNHLDLPSVERLEAALRGWPGALLLVTHDERLAAACTRRRWRMSGGLVDAT